MQKGFIRNGKIVRLKQKRKPKLIAYCDSPICHSGFGVVSRNILGLLHETGLFDITVFGINHYTESDDFARIAKPNVPYEILPASYITAEEYDAGYDDDMYGKKKLLKLMYQNKYDVFWSVQDTFIVSFLKDAFKAYEKIGKKMISMLYFPVDGDIKKEWAEIPFSFDYPIVYTRYGKQQIMKHLPDKTDLRVIPHGTNVKDFYVLSPQKKKNIRKQLGIADDTCVVINVNRNQPRKDLGRTFQVFREFKKQIPNSVLLMFCNPVDAGGDLFTRMKYYGLEHNKDVIFPDFPKGKGAFKGVPVEAVNEAYNIADMCVSTTLGEGWGLSLTEAMAVKVPVIFPAHSSINEILGDDERGWKVKCGSTNSEFIQLPLQADDPIRPLTNIDDMLADMLFVWENRNQREVLDRVDEAYEWAKEHSWDKIFNEYWYPLFQEVHKNFIS